MLLPISLHYLWAKLRQQVFVVQVKMVKQDGRIRTIQSLVIELITEIRDGRNQSLGMRKHHEPRRTFSLQL